MPLPNEPVTLSVEQIQLLNRRLSELRHDINNNLSLMLAAMELIQRRPESAERMWPTMLEQPKKITEAVRTFTEHFDQALKITRP